jgi:hypothetical protein
LNGARRDEKGQTDGLAFALQISQTTARRIGSSMRGGERNAFTDLTDRPIDQLDGALAMAAFVGKRRFQFRPGVYQKRKRRIHARLRAQGVSNAQARNDENSH